MKRTIAKDIGRIGKRTIVDFLLLCQNPKVPVDRSLTITAGYHYGLGFSLLTPRFLFEVNLLPLSNHTHLHHMEND